MDHDWLTTANGTLLAKIINDTSSGKGVHELDGVFRVTQHITTLQIVDVEVTRQAQAYLDDCTAVRVLDDLIRTRQCFDTNRDILWHQQQLLLLNEDARLDLGRHTVTDQRARVLLHIVRDGDTQRLCVGSIWQLEAVQDLNKTGLVYTIPAREQGI